MDAVAVGARKHVSKHQIQSESVENEQADAGREGQTCLARLNFQARTATGKNDFSCSADHEQDWQPYRLIPPPILSACPVQTNSGRGKKEAHINWSMVTCQGSTRYWDYLDDYWPCTGGLSAVNAIGTQLRDPINSGLTRWRVVV